MPAEIIYTCQYQCFSPSSSTSFTYPYHQAFCGLTEFSRDLPCDSSELSHFRKRIGQDGMERLFRMSVSLQGKAALEDSVHVDTTVQEKNIAYPTDGKLAIKIINRLNKLAKAHGIRQRRTYANCRRGQP